MNINTLANSINCSLNDLGLVQIEVSARHVHLTKDDVEKLFGKGYELTAKRELSQPRQYLCEERVDIVTEKSVFKNVAILGPVRGKTQVEISKTDSRTLGLDVPVRESGDVANTPGITLRTQNASIKIDSGTIIAKRHIHVTPEIAKILNLKDKDVVLVETMTDRKTIFDDVIIRVSDQFRFRMHVDFDEANAANIDPKFCLGKIIK